jgi:hypothetical protein
MERLNVEGGRGRELNMVTSGWHYGLALKVRKFTLHWAGQVLRIQTLLTRIQILLFTLILIRFLLSNRIRIRLFDPDPFRSKEVMYLKQYFFIHLYFLFLVSRSNRTHKKGTLCSILPSS